MAKLKKKSPTKLLDIGFEATLGLKALFAFGETISGVLLFFITPTWLNGLINRITRAELREDPNDWLSNLLVRFGHNFTSSAALLAGIYLLLHGVIKLVTLFLLWRKILWAYPLAIIVFFGFIAYQVFEFVSRHSVFMILVTALDLFMIVLTWLEYRKMKGEWGDTA